MEREGGGTEGRARGEGRRKQEKIKKRGREGKDRNERNLVEGNRKDQSGQKLQH